MILNLFRDPVWQFVGVVLGIAALLLSFWISRKQSRRKSLSWDITKQTTLSSFNISDKVRSTVIFNEISINDANLINLQISNTGNIEISPNDYIEPIRFQFGKATILEAKIVKTIPATILDKAFIKESTDSIILKPLLLNSKDAVEIEVLLTNFYTAIDDIKVFGRIAGVKEINQVEHNKAYVPIIGMAFIDMFGMISKTIAMIIGIAFLCGLVLALLAGISFFIFHFIPPKNFFGLFDRALLVLVTIMTSIIPSGLMYTTLLKRLGERTNTKTGKRVLIFTSALLFILIMITFNIVLSFFNLSANRFFSDGGYLWTGKLGSLPLDWW